MSGGHFDYQQYRLQDIADEIVKLIHRNDDQTPNDWGCPRGGSYSEAALKEFWTAVQLLRQAQTYTDRIDWLVSGDDGEEMFHQRLKADLQEVDARLLRDRTQFPIEEDED